MTNKLVYLNDKHVGLFKFFDNTKMHEYIYCNILHIENLPPFYDLLNVCYMHIRVNNLASSNRNMRCKSHGIVLR